MLNVCHELHLVLDVFTLCEVTVTGFKTLITNFSDIFALDYSELGCTDMLQHFIDTGNHPPMEQQLYRIAVVRYSKVSEMPPWRSKELCSLILSLGQPCCSGSKEE